ILTLAKGLGGGLPIGACIGLGSAAELLTPGSHGSTFGGNPVSCAAALAVLQTIEQDGLLANVRDVGGLLGTALGGLTDPLVTSARGSGVWWGLVLSSAAAAAVEAAARERGLLVNAVRPEVIRLAPALLVDAPTVTDAVARLADAVRAVSVELTEQELAEQGAAS
ncbi:MAG: aminotransferase class III-fold pyridoxal phosphate-dependent enzyme, partial [Jatrophihabitantaceae bacterium]